MFNNESRSTFYNESGSESGSSPHFIMYPYDGDVGAGVGFVLPWPLHRAWPSSLDETMGPVILYPGFSGDTCVKIKMWYDVKCVGVRCALQCYTHAVKYSNKKYLNGSTDCVISLSSDITNKLQEPLAYQQHQNSSLLWITRTTRPMVSNIFHSTLVNHYTV